MRELGTPLAIHQPSYSMFNRWIEAGLTEACGDEGLGIIAFSPLAQGLLTNKYLGGVPDDSRAARGGSFSSSLVTDDVVARLNALAGIAESREQTLAQLALSWALRDERVTSVLIGARTVAQLEDSLGALDRLDFTESELADIDKYAVEAGLNLWARSNEA
jgi:L-glyceraldehyde 3-phosphate reductase